MTLYMLTTKNTFVGIQTKNNSILHIELMKVFPLYFFSFLELTHLQSREINFQSLCENLSTR